MKLTATCNEAFLKRSKAVLSNQHFKNEVEKAVTRRKQVVFAGHSSGGGHCHPGNNLVLGTVRSTRL
ncbi:hypothetical protein NC652_029629 [Populus alba x Populus x berolinensis]|nr:hypothetical protein NC652_029629 [Populus alba x Populus x berolinensis]